ncbi:MAG: hypothetical protein JWP76_1455, partial [Dactylosporangium sp.]|nr:hypothetical protein [Dactylosporangium sp.]
TSSQARTDRVWWLLAPNPFVVLADAAPRIPVRPDPVTGYPRREPLDPLGGIGLEARRLRDPRGAVATSSDTTDSKPVWPYGLGFDLLLGIGACWLTVRRLRAPASTLAKGVRVA